MSDRVVRHARTSALLLLAILLAPRPAAQAQELHGSIDAGLSHARPPAGVESEPASYLLGGGRLFTGPFFATVYGGLAAGEDAGSWIASEAGLQAGRPLASWLRGSVSLRGAAFSVGDPTPYRAFLGRVTPALRAIKGRTQVTVRGHGGIGTSEVLDFRSDRTLYGAGAEVGYTFAGLTAGVGADVYEAEEGGYATAYAIAAGFARHFDWTGELRVWDVPAGDAEVEIMLAISVPLGRAWSFHVSGGRSGPDPLLGTPPGVSGGALASWSFSRSAAPPIFSVEEGELVFRLCHPDAERVEVIGGFSAWRPVTMRQEDGEWRARVPVGPGVYHFGFLVDGEWHVPEDAPGLVDDEFGRRNATVVVPGPGDPEGR